MKKSFILYYDQYKTISLLSQEEKGELLDAIYQSHNGGIEFEMTPKVELVFSMLEGQFQRDGEKRDNIREARSKAGSKGGQKTQSKAKSSKIKQNQANEAVNDNVTVTVTVTDTVNANDNLTKKRTETKKTSFIPPTLEEVISYFKENGYKEDIAKKAFNIYNVADWYDTKGSKVRVRKQKMHSVRFKDENKAPKELPKDNSHIKNIYDLSHLQCNI